MTISGPRVAGGGSSRRVGRPRDGRVDRAVVAATVALLVEGGGVDSLSIDDIAARAGVGKASIYRRWPNKHALLNSVVADLPEVVPDLTGVGVPDGLRRVCVSLLVSARDEEVGRLLPALAGLGRADPELLERYLSVAAGGRRRLLRQLLERGVGTGEIRDDVDPVDAAGLIVRSILGYGLLATAGDQDTVDDFLDLVLRGLRPRCPGSL
ncbi:TetR family transcriptional regulator [Micromonospora pisi]|uniref:TetR family transcriptional regulator n=1 Tax=Micromonospora pisi TaxID=589240 RepID=A0A495JN90_9ACTN|nr:TetR/AcrR family transcriptional regulator [Micromonospora pisi]RKR90393.1 TetR family transcriptional regulator [Micromonospora pisi]